jgi:hypothetical protein
LVADDLGLRVVPGAVQRPLSLLFGITTTDEPRVSVRVAAGVDAEVFDAMHLSVYDGAVLDLSDLAEDKASVQRCSRRAGRAPQGPHGGVERVHQGDSG